MTGPPPPPDSGARNEYIVTIITTIPIVVHRTSDTKRSIVRTTESTDTYAHATRHETRTKIKSFGIGIMNENAIRSERANQKKK